MEIIAFHLLLYLSVYYMLSPVIPSSAHVGWCGQRYPTMGPFSFRFTSNNNRPSTEKRVSRDTFATNQARCHFSMWNGKNTDPWLETFGQSGGGSQPTRRVSSIGNRWQKRLIKILMLLCSNSTSIILRLTEQTSIVSTYKTTLTLEVCKELSLSRFPSLETWENHQFST